MRALLLIIGLLLAFKPQSLRAEERDQDAARIEIDQEAKAFVFIIDDKPVALLDESGLHVVEHISYGGSMTDKGPESVRRDIESRLRGEAEDER